MRNLMLVGAMMMTAAGLSGVAGCDETLESEREVEVKDDGTKVIEEEKTVEKADGTIEKTEEKRVETPE